MKLHHAEILHRERFGKHALLRYRWTGEAPEPGQFVMVRPVSSTRALDPFLPRPFFAHDHEDGATSLLFEVRGRGTAILAEEHDELLVSGPLGRGFGIDGGPVALVGGGVWVAPLKLLSRRLTQRGVPHDTFLEAPQDAPRAYVAWISNSYPEARIVPTGAGDGAAQKLLDEMGNLGRYATLYASGLPETLAAVKRVSDEGRVPAQLALRERMACANGSCYGCAVPLRDGDGISYARACVEGPVFPAEALAW